MRAADHGVPPCETLGLPSHARVTSRVPVCGTELCVVVFLQAVSCSIHRNTP